MSAPITETDTYAPGIQTPVLGDKFTYPDVVKQAFTDLANRTHFIQNTLDGGSGSTAVLDTTNTIISPVNSYVVPLTTRGRMIYNLAFGVISTLRYLRSCTWGATESITFMPVPICPHTNSDGAGNYGPPGGSLPVGGPYWNSWVYSERLAWYQIATPGGATAIYWSVRGMPPSGKIVSFNLRVQGGSGHAGLPTTMPTLGLWKQSYAGTPTLIASVTDASANFTAYQAEHDLTVTNLTEIIAPNTNYFFKLTGETGTNKQPNYTAFECGLSIGVP